MKLYINGRFLTQPMTGVERYAYKMCQALSANGQSFTIVCPHADIQPCYDVSSFHIVHFGRGGSHLWEQCVLPFFFLTKRDYLVISFTGLGSILIRRKVMTIHDLSFLEDPSWFSKAYYWWYKVMTPLAVMTSRAVITVSEFSKREILRFYSFLQPERIHVIYGAVDSQLFKHEPSSASQLPSAVSQLPSSTPYVLAVSSLDPRKNFKRLVQAFQHISDCHLCIVGSHNRVFTDGTDADNTATNIKYLGRVSDDELVSLYNHAACFIFPSLYEGFGLPPLEAMACGCPVLASNIPVISEVCGGAARYFNPLDPDDILRAVTQYLAHADVIKETMRQRGYDNVTRFSWQQSAKKLIEKLQQMSC